MENLVKTPHIIASADAFGKTVLMPGDPLRAQYIAEHYLENPVLINNIRGVQGYTGNYHGKKVSVMASGMGMPSIGIYSYELYHFFHVENIIRVGSCGAMNEKVQVRDLIFGLGACTDSSYLDDFNLPGTYAPICSFELLEKAVSVAKEKNYRYFVGNLLSSDHFYHDGENASLPWQKMGVLGVEMESASLYANANRVGKKALCVCTVSDHLLTGKELSAEERQNSFDEMILLALEVATRD